MLDVDLTVLTDDELRLAFDELCASLSDCHDDDRRAFHLALMDVSVELRRRTDLWIAQRKANA